MLQEITHIFSRPRQKPTQKSPQHAKRCSDAIIILRQDNLSHSLKIEALNLLAINILGFENEEIVEHDFRVILPENIGNLVNEHLEFRPYSQGVDSILMKISDFKIKTKDNAEIPVKIKVARTISSSNIARFQVVINDISLQQSLQSHRNAYRALMRGDEIFEKKTALLTRASIEKDMEFIANFSERSMKDACFAIYGFGSYTALRHEHGDEGAFNMLRNMIKTIETTKRGNDILGILDNGGAIVILPETPFDNIKIAINRIYSKLPQEIKSEVKIQYDVIKTSIPVNLQIETALKSKAGIF